MANLITVEELRQQKATKGFERLAHVFQRLSEQTVRTTDAMIKFMAAHEAAKDRCERGRE